MGSVIISPKGEILAESLEPGGMAMVDIDPFGGRDNADWSNAQTDMRARLFRERRPETFAQLTQTTPKALEKLPEIQPFPPREIAAMVRCATTMGHVEYERAEQLLRDGETGQAVAAFEKLIEDYPSTWFDRTARKRLAELQDPEEDRR